MGRLIILRLCALAALLTAGGCLPPDVPPPHMAGNTARDYTGALAVFPGAEGFGTDTRAGRGGDVLRVTTLDNDGPGSLRAALSAAGARTVVFDVAGTIWLTECLEVVHPFVTLAGQTAPAPGITLAGAGLVIHTSDVLVQHLRIRAGDAPGGPPPEGRDCLSIYGGDDAPAERIVVDHCSLSWAIDEGASTWGKQVRDVTIRHCIMAENLAHSLHPEGEHSKGLLLGDHAQRVSVIRCLFASNTERNPLIKGDVSALVVNNVVYNPGFLAIHISAPEQQGPSCAAIVNNVFIPGPDTPWWTPFVTVLPDVDDGSRFYVAGNVSPRHIDCLHLNRLGRCAKTQDVTVAPLTLLDAAAVRDTVLAQAGARPAQRDDADTRVTRDVVQGAGRVIDSPVDVGGYTPAGSVQRPCELPANPNDDDDRDGYTNIEERLHTLAEEVE